MSPSQLANAAPATQAASWPRRAFSLDLRSLGAFRAAIGAIVAADALLRSRDVSLMFAPDGMFPLAALRQYLPSPCAWSLATLVDAAWCGPAILVAEFAAGLFLAAGCGTRWATVAAWVAVVSVLRRTAPATNAGDAWLACLLFWGMFLPLGAAWSWDRRRESGRGLVFSAASIALVLQIAVVYGSAGVAKWNATWLSGDAIRYAMSVHDHGTAYGEWLFGSGWLSRPLSWAVMAGELAGPLALIFLPRPSVRLTLVAAFMLFHAAICLTMSVGLFGYVGLAAWLAVLPAEAWDRLQGGSPAAPVAQHRWIGLGTGLCLVAGLLAIVSLAHDVTAWRSTPLPRWVTALVDIPCMHQEWRMFDEVRPQEQWVYARGELADGRLVDVLRGGRPLQTVRPDGGFTSLPHHRWHKLFWCLAARSEAVPVRRAVAAALARDWNSRHGSRDQLSSLEIRVVRQGRTADDDTMQEALLAAWPPRDAGGRGGLDRLLEDERLHTAPGPDPITERR